MATLFTKIIDGQIPGRFVWKDDKVVAFLTIAPLRAGHTLVVPRAEIDHWVDLPPDLAAHLLAVAAKVARGIHATFPSKKVGLMIAGLEVPHVHIHLTPIDGVKDMDFERQRHDVPAREMDDAAKRLRDTLVKQGHAEAKA
jgi:histidine triad (HIT) family protein